MVFVAMSCTANLVYATDQKGSAPEPATTALAQTVAAISATSARDSQGRVAVFADSWGRTFSVEYDESGRISSVKSPEGRNRADLPRIVYSAEGLLAHVLLGDGNELTFSYDENGVQYVQDRYGALVRRNRTTDGYHTFSEDDPSTRLRATVERLDALLTALGRVG